MPAMVLTSWTLLVWEELEDSGCDARAIFKKAKLSPEHLGDANARYPVVAMQRLWPLAIEASGNPDFAYRVGRRWRPTPTGAYSSSSPRPAFHASSRSRPTTGSSR